MAEVSVKGTRTTRQFRVDEEFLELLEVDFEVSYWELNQAFGGVPGAPKKQAIEICEWAARKSDDPEERGRMIRGWARNRKVGMYSPRMQDNEPATYGGREAAGV